MALTTEQQDFLDSFTANTARFVAAFTAAAEAQNDQTGTTLDQVRPLQNELGMAVQLVSGNMGNSGLWYPFKTTAETSPGVYEETPIDCGPDTPRIL